ncbi:hypothetical protein BN2127_JRS10_02382 [Bacillus subtilis]|nr:hypothetical protein BN2127_JRS10_02382 [Bacillus subtilis]
MSFNATKERFAVFCGSNVAVLTVVSVSGVVMVVVTGGSLGFGSYVNVIFALFLMTPPGGILFTIP